MAPLARLLPPPLTSLTVALRLDTDAAQAALVTVPLAAKPRLKELRIEFTDDAQVRGADQRPFCGHTQLRKSDLTGYKA
jgi:hypothetical protein